MSRTHGLMGLRQAITMKRLETIGRVVAHRRWLSLPFDATYRFRLHGNAAFSLLILSLSRHLACPMTSFQYASGSLDCADNLRRMANKIHTIFLHLCSAAADWAHRSHWLAGRQFIILFGKRHACHDNDKACVVHNTFFSPVSQSTQYSRVDSADWANKILIRESESITQLLSRQPDFVSAPHFDDDWWLMIDDCEGIDYKGLAEHIDSFMRRFGAGCVARIVSRFAETCFLAASSDSIDYVANCKIDVNNNNRAFCCCHEQFLSRLCVLNSACDAFARWLSI